ncbi:lysophospholipid acyltransferase family protein [Dactylosporangium sp. NPDC051541]|uniref:lysophospholipid acyltransferase family protein n=1 Tax=Dactylosporangium sp. NPDC051541 TaxID=3363977 RepID=UPI0037BC4C2C
MPLVYRLTRATAGRALRWGWRPRVHGLHHIPPGGAILAGNHLSVADELFLGALVPRHVAFWAKAEYFRGHRLAGMLVRGLGAIPVERAGGRAVLTAFAAAVPVLRGGGLVAVFPEGTRSPDGRLYRGRTGAVRLARQAGVPIVPFAVTGTDAVQPIDARRPRLATGTRIEVRFGPAADVAEGSVRAATDGVMARIGELSGQEYVPSYAPLLRLGR